MSLVIESPAKVSMVVLVDSENESNPDNMADVRSDAGPALGIPSVNGRESSSDPTFTLFNSTLNADSPSGSPTHESTSEAGSVRSMPVGPISEQFSTHRLSSDSLFEPTPPTNGTSSLAPTQTTMSSQPSQDRRYRHHSAIEVCL